MVAMIRYVSEAGALPARSAVVQHCACGCWMVRLLRNGGHVRYERVRRLTRAQQVARGWCDRGERP